MKDFIELTIIADGEDDGTKSLFAVRNIERVLPPHPQAEGNAGAFVKMKGRADGLDVAESYDSIKALLTA